MYQMVILEITSHYVKIGIDTLDASGELIDLAKSIDINHIGRIELEAS